MMNLEAIEQNSMDKYSFDATEKIQTLNKAFKSSLTPNGRFYESSDKEIVSNATKWANAENNMESIAISKGNVQEIIRNMYNGEVPSEKTVNIKMDGKTIEEVRIPGVATRGLKEISHMRINPEYRYQNVCQQSGFAAEVISTAKENLIADMKGTGLKTFRADDLPDLFRTNDQFVDKVRIDSNGNVVEKVQTKFVGKDGSDCLSKLMSKKFDKYFQDGKVDKLEVPNDYYDEIKAGIKDRVSSYERQSDRVKADGNTEAAEALQAKLAKLNKLDSMLEQSNTSSYEARYARLHPERYMSKLTKTGESTISNKEMQFALKHEKIYNQNAATGVELGVKTGLGAAGITAAISTVDNVTKYMDGQISAQNATLNIAEDTAKAGGIGLVTGFVSGTVASAMSVSSHKLISAIGKIGAPGAVVAFGVDCYDSVVDYAQGEIDGQELAYDLGHSAVGVAGNIAGAAATGAIVGSVVPGAGTVIGAATGLVGGMVGYALASEAYATAVETVSEYADEIGEKAQEVANATIEKATELGSDIAESVTNAIKDFNIENALPFSI